MFPTTVRGQLLAAQSAVRHMGAGGRVVLTSSISARRAFERHTPYSASKAAVEVVVLNLAVELGRRGITINAIAPGGVATDMSASAEADFAIGWSGRGGVSCRAWWGGGGCSGPRSAASLF